MDHFLILWHDFCPRLQFPCSLAVIARRIFGQASDEESFYCSVAIIWDDATEVELGRAIFYLLQKWRHNAIEFLMSVHNKRTFVILARTPPKTSCGNVSDCNHHLQETIRRNQTFCHSLDSHWYYEPGYKQLFSSAALFLFGLFMWSKNRFP